MIMSYCPKCNDLVDVDHERINGEIHDFCDRCHTDITEYEKNLKKHSKKRKSKVK